MLITLAIIYVIGAVYAAYLLYRQHRNWTARYPDEHPTYYEYGFWTVGTMLSWLTVGLIFMCALTSVNRIEEE